MKKDKGARLVIPQVISHLLPLGIIHTVQHPGVRQKRQRQASRKGSHSWKPPKGLRSRGETNAATAGSRIHDELHMWLKCNVFIFMNPKGSLNDR